MAEPKQLPDGCIIDAFTVDSRNGWVVVYAGPCIDPACKDKPHMRLYLVPMIGWLHVRIPWGDDEELSIRPAVMFSTGDVTDYLDFPSELKFVAVLPETGEVTKIARAMFHEKYGDDQEIDFVESPSLPN